ncbi:MAG: hypothetical protein GT601_14320 [Acidaminobacter sp.]|uniref:tyrosine-protein phosphatase n=1 Tax=Acidaminobacter sp. TaxID=1872102 RepID=UPI00137E8F63|nr:CpsB/CapC family capsule biosynthesis tyrosine phosphatase [Acidaminobacter sp.]MZQ98840.1 hypothetical protein [Acidaminobacter sp.]
MYDLHSHLLPNIPGDDGARSYDMAYHMARQSLTAGFSHVIATSHFVAGEPFGRREDLQAAARAISKFLLGKGMPLEIIPAHEAYLTPELIDHVKSREVILIGNRYLLLELPMTGWMRETFSLLSDLNAMGVKVIIAHPERCAALQENPDLAVELIDSGAYLQLNLGSLKYTHTSTGKTALKLLKYNMYHFVGTGAHSDQKRSPLVQEELALLKKITSHTYFAQITRENAALAVKGIDFDNSFDESWTSFDREDRAVPFNLRTNIWQRLEAWRFARR